MRNVALSVFVSGLLLTGTGCDRKEQREADEKASQARAKARELSRKAEQQAAQVKREVNEAISPEKRASAEAKLRKGAEDLRAEGRDAALITQVKAQLARKVGLDAMGSVNVDTEDAVVTLRGTVSSDEQRRQAERAAAGVPGVARVINHLQVKE